MATSSAAVAESRSGPRNRAVRWNEPSLLRMTPRSTRAAHGRKSARLWARRRYSVRFIMARTSRAEMRRVTKMPPHDIDEGWIAPGRPNRRQMTDQPDGRAGKPQAQAEADRGGERAVDDHHRARRAAQKQRFRERAMDRGVEAGDGLARLHQ